MGQRRADTEVPIEFLIPVLTLCYGGKWFVRDWCWDWCCKMDSGIKAGDGTELCGVLSTAGKGSLTGWRSGILQTLGHLSKAK